MPWGPGYALHRFHPFGLLACPTLIVTSKSHATLANATLISMVSYPLTRTCVSQGLRGTTIFAFINRDLRPTLSPFLNLSGASSGLQLKERMSLSFEVLCR